MLSGLCFTPENRILSCGHDKTAKLWEMDLSHPSSEENESSQVNTFSVSIGLLSDQCVSAETSNSLYRESAIKVCR